MGSAAPSLAAVESAVSNALTELVEMPGVYRVGLALSEGGGRRLRFTASDRDNARSVAWCHIDAYDDVPLTTVLRTGRPVTGHPSELEPRYPGFAARQLGLGTAGVAAFPLVEAGTTTGAVIFFYDSPQPFDADQLAALGRLCDDLTGRVRAARRSTGRRGRTLADEPVPAGARVADLAADGDQRSVGVARRWASDTLAGWAVAEEQVDIVVLCLSELVTNAVVHAATSFEVRLVLEGGRLLTSVRDEGGQPLDEGRDPALDPLRVHGRGLLVVDALAARRGSSSTEAGTTAWFELDLP